MNGMNPSNDAGGQAPVPGPMPGGAGNSGADNAGPASDAVPPMTFPLPPAAPPADQPANPGNIAQTPLQSDVSPTTQPATPQVIDDGDLIEKEWVNKAKQIVEQNRNDPHKQSEELTVFRADYMKKRYNKNIKLGD
jgi:hypothetical protein